MGILRGAFFIVGGTIGAGFITGAELVRFFGAESFLLPLFFSCSLFFVLSVLYLRLGKKHGGFDGVMKLFGKGEKGVRFVFYFCAFVSSAGMLAGLDALLPELSPLLSVLGLLLSVFFVEKGTDGVSKLNFVLIPVLLFFVFVFCGEMDFGYPRGGANAGPFLYAGMNAFFLAPVLMDAGGEMRHPVFSSLLAAGTVFLTAVCILGSICREGANALNAEMPFLKVARGKIFSVAVGVAILTSLISSLYTLISACNRARGKKKTAAKICVLSAAFCLSRIGLKGIVDLLYPFIGGAGLFFSALCILYDQFLEKYHKRIHSRRKHAEDASCAHHEVKLKHLPAVHDEIPETRP